MKKVALALQFLIKPEGPYKDYLGKPLVGKFHNGAQPIDQFVFKDKMVSTILSTVDGNTAILPG